MEHISCKFTPLEFETLLELFIASLHESVNLLRWSLKHKIAPKIYHIHNRVNLLRWSLKPKVRDFDGRTFYGVNLLRWSLKPVHHVAVAIGLQV